MSLNDLFTFLVCFFFFFFFFRGFIIVNFHLKINLPLKQGHRLYTDSDEQIIMGVRKRSKETENNRNSSSPSTEDVQLIPSSILDLASQRLFVTSFFMIIQCWKLYDVLLLRTNLKSTTTSEYSQLNTLTFVIKYALLDGLFLWFLPVLSIPYLKFSPIKTFLFAIILNCMTFFLVSDAAAPLLTYVIIPLSRTLLKKRELTIVGDSLAINNVIDSNAHFKGRITIHYLPDSSARLNPFHFDKLCINPITNEAIQMPIEFNTTSEIGFLQLQQITPNEQQRYINFTYHDLQRLIRKDYSHLKTLKRKLPENDHIFYIEVPLSLPGLYRINSVSDRRGSSIRTYKSDFKASYCPSTSFYYPNPKNSYGGYKCILENNNVDQNSLPLIKAFGALPLIIRIDAFFDEVPYKTFNLSLARNVLSRDGDSSLHDLQTYTVSSELISTIDNESFVFPSQSGKLEFRVNEVIDSLGCKQKYNPVSKDEDIYYEVFLKKAPLVEFSGSRNALGLYNESTQLNLSVNEDLLPTDYPLNVEMSYSKSKQSGKEVLKVIFKNSNDIQNGIQIDRAGIYKLLKASSKYCTCNIGAHNEKELRLAPPPTVEINAAPILDKCVGMTGYDFEFKFEGKPPFTLDYHVYHNVSGSLKPVYNDAGLARKSIESDKKAFKYAYKPPKEGNYALIFDTLRDQNYYKLPLLIDRAKHTYLTHFNQRSRVSFFDKVGHFEKEVNVCLQDAPSLDIYLQGNFPFTFSYTLVNAKNGEIVVQRTRINEVKDSVFNIQFPAMDKGGIFEVKVSDVTDGFGCLVDFDEREHFRLRVRSDIPSIFIDKDQASQNIKLVEGDFYTIPLILKSTVGRQSSDILEYTFRDLHNMSLGKQRTLRNFRSLQVKDEGFYSLKGFTNGGCPGKVLNEDYEIQVSYYPRPELHISANDTAIIEELLDQGSSFLRLKPVCRNCESIINVELIGQLPFILEYEIKSPTGRSEQRLMTINSNSATLKLPTGESGTYEHIFKGVYDTLYTKSKMQRLAKPNALPRVQYRVNPLPYAKFEKNSRFLQTCESNLHQMELPFESIHVELIGSFPFSLKASLMRQDTRENISFVVDNLTESILDLNTVTINQKPLQSFLKVGDYILTLDELTDANGCYTNTFPSTNSVIISITEIPTMSKIRPKPHYCVGDRILYNIAGLPPFIVIYSFNKKIQKAELPKIFNRLASKPGNLTILGLQDSSANACKVNFTQLPEVQSSLNLEIHDLPSVEVNQGSNIIEDIHEGDQVEINFSFSGTPPFRLVYTRTYEQHHGKSHKSGTIVETKAIEGIWDYEYTVMANLEGTYEAVEVEDAYCRAEKSI